MQTKSILNGKEINLTSDDMSIKSTNFNVDKNGTLTCKNAKLENVSVEGGSINLQANGLDIFRVMKNNSTSTMTYITESVVGINDNSTHSELWVGGGKAGLNLTTSGSETLLTNQEVKSPLITQTSLEEKKKNFEKLKNALDIIKKVDIYKYNLKFEEDTDKKHIGFVIGEKFNYSKDLTNKENDSVDIYSLASVCVKAIQEQDNLIQDLLTRVEKLEKGEQHVS